MRFFFFGLDRKPAKIVTVRADRTAARIRSAPILTERPIRLGRPGHEEKPLAIEPAQVEPASIEPRRACLHINVFRVAKREGKSERP
jgi:hypothetical protein